MKKYASLFFILIILAKLAYSQYDRGYVDDYEDDDQMSISDVGMMLVVGAAFAIVGYILMQIKSVSGLGKAILGFGAFIGIGSVVVYLLNIIGKILAATLSFAFKAVIVIGIIVFVFYILKSIYDWFSK